MINEIKYVAYYRVSTQQQGRSGLGLEAQQADVKRFLGQQLPVTTYTEIESGGNNKRPQLQKAVDYCLKNNAILLIAKLDRLSRNVLFIETLKDKGVKFKCCDMPDANEFIIGIMAQFAQYERKIISDRIKSALQAAKQRGTKLGGATPEHMAYARSKRKPVQYDKAIIYMIQKERDKGHSFEAIAFTLDLAGYKTNRNKPFSATAVYRIYHNLKSVPPCNKGFNG